MPEYYFRFSLGQRLLHGLLMTSFLGLATTGMPLHFSQSRWAIWLAHTLGGFGVMGFFHRTFAFLLTLCFLIHLGQLGYRLFVGRELQVLWGPDSLVPQPRDLVEFGRHVRWFFGLGPRPRFGRFTYWEKFDYFAVFWGMAIIGGSGYVLWFHGVFSRLLPGWLFNVAHLVHGEEALLAVGFIFTIHFFNSHLRPEKFPMDLVIFTGRVSEDELRSERPEEYERLHREGRLRAIEADPPPLWLRNFGRIVGATAVTVGLVIFTFIVLAVLAR
ncbi:MAG: cytochrome b/b6 domain-containing protein [Candidatus Rokubacteria bacterium]|nr:cytochrome b/b6 domain-containing protein [Candidatus Rokubacteria bacterium]